MAYTGPTLESLQDEWLDPQCMAALGDSVSYQPQGGGATPLKAYVDFGEALRDIETGTIVDQEISVEMRMADVPVRPNSACRLTFARIPGVTFKPINVMIGSSGTHWKFGVARTNG